MASKRDLKKERDRRVGISASLLRPRWRRCFWTLPWGHIYDGRRARDLGIGKDGYAQVCLYCGHPRYFDDWYNVRELEDLAAVAHLYPIAQGKQKREALSA